MYAPTWGSVSTHPLPDWYDDAKLGIFIHWGLYSVPGWAPQVPDIQQLLKEEGPTGVLRDNPYAEWFKKAPKTNLPAIRMLQSAYLDVMHHLTGNHTPCKVII